MTPEQLALFYLWMLKEISRRVTTPTIELCEEYALMVESGSAPKNLGGIDTHECEKCGVWSILPKEDVTP